MSKAMNIRVSKQIRNIKKFKIKTLHVKKHMRGKDVFQLYRVR